MKTDVFTGGFNTVSLRQDGVVVRTSLSAQEQTATLQQVSLEYAAMGLSELGVGFRNRTPEEQVEFSSKLGSLGLNVADYKLCPDGITYRFIEGVILSDSLRQGEYGVLYPALESLHKAHSNGVSIGDRWTKNSVVSQMGGNIYELDFDIILEGDQAGAIQVDEAQTIYHALHFASSKREVVKRIIRYINEVDREGRVYDRVVIEDLLARQNNFFAINNGGVYEGLSTIATSFAVEELIKKFRITK